MSKTTKSKPRGRGPVVHLNRLSKAKMIEAIISDYITVPIENRRILDIGCGNGDISQYFSNYNDQYGVDLSDKRKEDNNDFDFKIVDSESLPFNEKYFDIVISHHVIEHVSDHDKHLEEIRRVLKDGGTVYLATPNKSSPIMEGHVGNDMVLKYKDMQPLFEKNGFSATEYGIKVIKNPDLFFGEARWAKIIPIFLLKLLRIYFPSHMFILTKK